jgi:3-deoxy-D-manno-octulosonic acid (KDO) 8-phosphate synthase
MSPESMKHAVQKVLDCNNDNVMVTDRGICLATRHGSVPMQQYVRFWM